MHEAIELHIEGLKEDGFPVPLSRSSAILCGGQVDEGTPLPTAAQIRGRAPRVKQSLNIIISALFRRNCDPHRRSLAADPGGGEGIHPLEITLAHIFVIALRSCRFPAIRRHCSAFSGSLISGSAVAVKTGKYPQCWLSFIAGKGGYQPRPRQHASPVTGAGLPRSHARRVGMLSCIETHLPDPCCTGVT